MPTIRELVDGAYVDGKYHKGRLARELVAREDAIADSLRVAGAQFGLYPEIVAEVLAEVGLGSPVSEEERALIRANFVNLMERLRREQQG
jgi:hypothetical protein